MIRFGRVAVLQSKKKEHTCQLCEEKILLNKYYILTTGKTPTYMFSMYFHLECFPQHIINRIHERRNNPRTNRKKTNPLDGLSSEQIARRQTLQKYLRGKDLMRLLNAYRQHDEEKVFRAYRIIASRWIELKQLNAPFRMSILTKKSLEAMTPQHRELVWWMNNSDKDWTESFANLDTPEEKIKALIRPCNETDRPVFAVDMQYEIKYYGGAWEGRRGSYEWQRAYPEPEPEHSLDVSNAERLPDV